MNDLKQGVFKLCLELVAIKKAQILSEIKAQQDAANNETKSSAGDKYETGRAMAHFEQEKLSGQLQQAQKNEQLLKSIDVAQVAEVVKQGALVETNQGYFFITIGMGAVVFNHQSVFVMSPTSPLSQKLLGLKINDSVNFMNKLFEIKSIC